MHSEHRQLNRVAIGIGMMLVSVVFAIITLFMFAGVPLLLQLSRSVAIVGTFLLPLIRHSVVLIGSATATSALLGTIGPCLCLAAPQRVKATEFILVSVFLNAVTLTLVPLGMLTVFPTWLSVLAASLPYFGIFAFLLFIRRLGAFLERPDIAKLARQAMFLELIAGAATVLVSIAGTVYFRTLSMQLGLSVLLLPMLLLLPIVALLSGVIAALRYIRALVYSRKAILAMVGNE